MYCFLVSQRLVGRAGFSYFFLFFSSLFGVCVWECAWLSAFVYFYFFSRFAVVLFLYSLLVGRKMTHQTGENTYIIICHCCSSSFILYYFYIHLLFHFFVMKNTHAAKVYMKWISSVVLVFWAMGTPDCCSITLLSHHYNIMCICASVFLSS